jgi:hypothetical protein
VNSKKLIEKMGKMGYYYNSIESYKGYLKFDYTFQVLPLVFNTWQEVKYYIDNIIIID